jgi:hypothetical protein
MFRCREVFHRIVGLLAVEPRVDDECRFRAHQQRVAVGRRLCDVLRTDLVRGAGFVLDDDLLAPALGQSLPEHPRENIGYTAGRSRYHHGDGLVWIALTKGDPGRQVEPHGGNKTLRETQAPDRDRARKRPTGFGLSMHHAREESAGHLPTRKTQHDIGATARNALAVCLLSIFKAQRARLATGLGAPHLQTSSLGVTNVRFGSQADICTATTTNWVTELCLLHLQKRTCAVQLACLLWANTGHGGGH